ncbi:MAG: outer membrane beta-barrel protein [Candidatus Aminicenantaceae bacterium]
MQKLLFKRKNQSLVFKSILKVLCIMIIMFFGMLIHPANAQQRFQGGINGQGFFPQGEFKDNISNAGGGFGLEFIYSSQKMPFGIGVSFGYLIYGSEKFSETIQTKNAVFDADLETINSIVLAHILFRFQPKQGRVRPYLDGLIGLNHITTDTKIKDEDFGDNDVSTNNINDTVLSYGGGFGLMIQVYERPWKKVNQTHIEKKWAVLLDFRVRYIRGNKGQYLKKGSIFRVDDDLFYDVNNSRTDFITAQLGITFNF